MRQYGRGNQPTRTEGSPLSSGLLKHNKRLRTVDTFTVPSVSVELFFTFVSIDFYFKG